VEKFDQTENFAAEQENFVGTKKTAESFVAEQGKIA